MKRKVLATRLTFSVSLDLPLQDPRTQDELELQLSNMLNSGRDTSVMGFGALNVSTTLVSQTKYYNRKVPA